MTNEEAIEVLQGMKSDFPLPKAAQTRRAQNDALDVAIEVLKAESCDDAISRQAAIDALKRISFSYYFECGGYLSEDTREIEIINSNKALEAIKALPPAQPEQRWIPFVLRPATDEEKEENPDLDYYLDGKLPEDGQRILITVNFLGREKVQADEFYIDADGAYLDGMYKIGTEAVAWMLLPEPYKEKQK